MPDARRQPAVAAGLGGVQREVRTTLHHVGDAGHESVAGLDGRTR